MSRNPERLNASVPAGRPVAHCAYCDAPLPAEKEARNAPRYCCYGCRVLGESSHRAPDATISGASSWFKIAVGAVLAVQAMLLGLATNLTPVAGPGRWLLHGALMVSCLASLVILGKPMFQAAWEEIRQRRITIELLFLSGILGALGISMLGSVTGRGPVYYEVVAILVTIYAAGKTLGARSRARALAETRLLQQRFERCQKFLADGRVESVPVAGVVAGDRVRVLAGEPIPVDGRIVRGQAFVCETPLTGEPFPVVRRAGDAVYAGSYSEDGELEIEATAGGTARRLDSLISALSQARDRTCRLQIQADRIVRWFLPVALLVSLGTFAFWTWQAGLATGLLNALAVLLVACPCAMGLATPMALWNGLAVLAARGLVVRSGDVLERLAGLDQVVFDKTGTLSEEQFSLVDLAAVGDLAQRHKILEQVQAVQSVSSHPVARAFVTNGVTVPSPYQVRSFKTVSGVGVEAWLEHADGTEIHVRMGQREMLPSGNGDPPLRQTLRHLPSDHLIYVEVDGVLQAVAAVREKLRGSANESLAWLRTLGIKTMVLTGDHAERAAGLVQKVAIQGSLQPQEKAQILAGWRSAGCQVGFVGDGVNDAPAMHEAEVGIALAHGAGVTTANADAILYGGDLRTIPWAVVLCRKVEQSIRSNLLFAAAYNLVGMTLAATGCLHPVAAALLMLVSSFTVSWRALRSTSEVGSCCLPGEEKETPLEGSSLRGQPLNRLHVFYAALMVLQVPFLAYLGDLGLGTSLALGAVMLALGGCMATFRTHDRERARLAAMSFAMLGLGNWGMILGWWADAGFFPTAGPCACMLQAFPWWPFATMPWMNLGMLAGGLPPMLLRPSPGIRRSVHLGLGLLSALGMVWGMSFGNYVFVKCFGPFAQGQFLLSFVGMTVGMMAGMLLFCEAGRALVLAWLPFAASKMGVRASHPSP